MSKPRDKSLPISIKSLRPWQATKLQQLFVEALEADFTFIDLTHRCTIKTQNATRHLAMAAVKPKRHIFLAWQEGVIIGFVIAGRDRNRSSNIDWLYVKPGIRGNNIGLKLLSRMMHRLSLYGVRYVTLVTYAYTDYYRRQGFRVLRQVESDGVMQDLMKYDFHHDEV